MVFGARWARGSVCARREITRVGPCGRAMVRSPFVPAGPSERVWADGDRPPPGDRVGPAGPGLPRASYRVGGRSPSPTYTSDSDDTLVHKARYYQLALWVGRRWYAAVHFGRRRVVRERRVVVCLTMLCRIGLAEPVVRKILSFLPAVADVHARRLPRYNRYGILVSPRDEEGSASRVLRDPWDDFA